MRSVRGLDSNDIGAMSWNGNGFGRCSDGPVRVCHFYNDCPNTIFRDATFTRFWDLEVVAAI